MDLVGERERVTFLKELANSIVREEKGSNESGD